MIVYATDVYVTFAWVEVESQQLEYQVEPSKPRGKRKLVKAAVRFIHLDRLGLLPPSATRQLERSKRSMEL